MSSDDGERLFVYGALMDAALRASIVGRSIDAIPARLIGWKRERRRYYFVERSAGETVEGAILEDLSARDLKILDEYEEVPALYTRQRIVVATRDGRSVECWIYIQTARVMADLP
ncbi:MAG TPA: gamma-glutamylcyclotransferase family protein [Candidatus Binataceae bacterium]|nr:gamma-glutamylcyclotransferase family protein [Candidatus Binataceae bacterium]